MQAVGKDVPSRRVMLGPEPSIHRPAGASILGARPRMTPGWILATGTGRQRPGHATPTFVDPLCSLTISPGSSPSSPHSCACHSNPVSPSPWAERGSFAAQTRSGWIPVTSTGMRDGFADVPLGTGELARAALIASQHRRKTRPSVGDADISPTGGEISRSLPAASPVVLKLQCRLWRETAPQPISPLVGEMSRSDRGGRACTDADEASSPENAVEYLRPASNSFPHGNPRA
jgi:hypothetical protein